MNGRSLRLAIALIVFMSTFYVCTILPESARASTLFVGGTGAGNRTTIEEAVINANPGDTIYVYNKTYNEYFEISKPLTLIGENKSTTVIMGSSYDYVVRISTDWVNITGFTITDNPSNPSESGLELNSAWDCHIHGNVISGTGRGIHMQHSNNNTIENNELSNNSYGLFGAYSQDNTITTNNFTSNDVFGVFLNHSNGNLIFNNNFIHNANQSFDANGINTWDLGQRVGGNCWSDYTGVDMCTGPDQDLCTIPELGIVRLMDNIGDTPYGIRGGPNEDRYPLMNPYGSPSPPGVVWIPADPGDLEMFSAILDPSNGETISGPYMIRGVCDNPNGTVERVEIRIDDGGWTQVNGTTDWHYLWRSIIVPDGEHTIYTRCFDGTNYSTETSITVIVDNDPWLGTSLSGDFWLYFGIVFASMLVPIVLVMFFIIKKERRRPREKQPPV